MRRTVAFVAAACVGGLAPPAYAHGPCECLSRYSGRPGQPVTVRSVSIRARFNPTKAQLPLGPPMLWSQHRDGVRTVELYRSRKPRKHRFKVPRVLPGDYVIAINDGSEGGAHYTWTDFAVKADDRTPATRRNRRQPSDGRFWLVGGLTGLVLLFVVLWRVRHRRANAS